MPLAEILRENVPLALYTTIGLGGPARYFARCSTLEDLREGLNWAAERGLPVQILGGGSNTLFLDEGFSGLVLHLGIQGIAFEADGAAILAIAAAGEDWDRFVWECVERGLSGIESLSGIPGQVGATPIQNVGAYGQEVGDTIAWVRALDRRTLELVDFSGEECGFAYRRSRFKAEDRDRYVVVEVAFRLCPEGWPEVRYPELRSYLERRVDLASLARGAPVLTAVRQAVLALRRSKSMVVDPGDPDSRSLGSFFLNPVLTEEEFAVLSAHFEAPDSIPVFPTAGGVKVSAAWLVEQAGFCRGFCRGKVGISRRHALALVNRGGTSQELLALAAEIQEEVNRRFGVCLEREPVVVRS